MAEETKPSGTGATPASGTAKPAPKSSPSTSGSTGSTAPKAPATPTAATATPAAKPAEKAKPKAAEKSEASEKATSDADEGPRAPKRATLENDERRLLHLRRSIDRRRPIFGRQAANRYVRIGRWGSWRRPRGLQSKQRRHYGYRPMVVSIGFRTPAKIRGLTPSGFRPQIVSNSAQLEGLDPKREAAIIAHGVGVRKRLLLEEAARKKGLHVLNPILKEEGGQ